MAWAAGNPYEARHARSSEPRAHVRLPAVILLVSLTWLLAGNGACSFALWRLRSNDVAEVSTAPVGSAQRRQLLAGLGSAVAALPAAPALAFETYESVTDGYQFKYPTGLQRSENSKGRYTLQLRDLLEPLESLGVKITPTSRKSLDEVGNATEVGKKIMADVIPEGAPQELISAKTKYDKAGRRADIVEYAYQWRFEPDAAKRLGRVRFQLHSKALVTINNRKQYLMIVSTEEKRWSNFGELICTAIDTFRLD